MDRCLEVHMEDECMLPTTVYVFQLLQSGIIFIALVAGVVSLTHILYFRFRTCANSGSLAVLVLVGLIHLISGIYQLQLSEYSTENGFPGCKTGGCLDMYVISTICNTLMLLVIVCKVITNNAPTKVQALLSLACFSLTTFMGLGMILRSPDNNQTKENDSIATLGKENQTHLEVFLSFCQKSVMEESYRLWFEYSLVYFPATFVVFVAWFRTKHQTKGSLIKLPVLSNDGCVEKQCSCIRLQQALAAMLVYSGFVLLHIRPLIIIYARSTSGYFRDVLPSLIHTTMYSFLCVEYITKIVLRDGAMHTGFYAEDGKSGIKSTVVYI